MATALSFANGTTAGVAVSAAPLTLEAMTITALITSVVTVYDNASAASGPILFQKTFVAADNNFRVLFPEPLRATAGMFLVVATAAAGVTFYVS